MVTFLHVEFAAKYQKLAPKYSNDAKYLVCGLLIATVCDF